MLTAYQADCSRPNCTRGKTSRTNVASAGAAGSYPTPGARSEPPLSPGILRPGRRSPENRPGVTSAKSPRRRLMPGSPEVGHEPGIISLIQEGCALLARHFTPTADGVKKFPEYLRLNLDAHHQNPLPSHNSGTTPIPPAENRSPARWQPGLLACGWAGLCESFSP